MVVEHNVTGEMCHAVRMVTPFVFKGEQRPAGDIVILGPKRRQVVTPSQFEYLFSEIEVGPDGCAADRPGARPGDAHRMNTQLPGVYIAARTEDQARAQELRREFAARGVRCVARWLDQVDVPRASAEGAAVCVEDIERSDVFLLLNPAEAHRTGTGGRHVETGIALAMGKPTLIFGVAENVFHTHDRVQVVPDDVSVSTLATIVKLAAASGTPLPVTPGARI